MPQFDSTDNSLVEFQDSSLAQKDSLEVVEISNPQLFQGAVGKTDQMEVIERQVGNPDWIVFVIIVALMSLIFVRLFFSKVFSQIKSHIITPAISRSALREENVQIRQAFLLLSFNFYIIGGLFLFLISERFSWDAAWMNSGFVRYMIFTLLLAIFFPLKVLGIRMLGLLFDKLPLAESYVFNIQLTNNTLGLLLVPITAGLAYIHWPYMNTAVIVISVLVIAFLMIQVLKGIFIWHNQRPFSLHYLIVYLCTLEFAPLLVVCKLSTF